MAKHNYEVKAKDLGDTHIDMDSFMPVRTLQIDVAIKSDPQHDGRPWSEHFSRGVEWELIEMIMQDIRVHVENAVRQTNPFGIHKV